MGCQEMNLDISTELKNQESQGRKLRNDMVFYFKNKNSFHQIEFEPCIPTRPVVLINGVRSTHWNRLIEKEGFRVKRVDFPYGRKYVSFIVTIVFLQG